MPKGIGARVAAVRARAQLMQKDFAARLGMPQSSVSEVESAKHEPSAEMLTRIAREFPDVSVSWLLTGNGAMQRRGAHERIFEDIQQVSGDVQFPIAPTALDADSPLKALHKMLSVIASRENLTHDQRDVVDSALQIVFGDQAAKQRIARRHRRHDAAVAAVGVLNDIEARMRWQVPEELKQVIISAIVQHGLKPKGAELILRAAEHAIRKARDAR